MALTLQILAGSNARSPSADRAVNYVGAVTNAGSTSVTLLSLAVFADLPGARVEQPFVGGNGAPGTVPVIPAGETQYFPFSVVAFSPNPAGPSPQEPNTQRGNGAASTDSSINLSMQSVSSDGTTATTTFFLPVLSPGNFTPGEGGALQMSQGANAVNFIMAFG